MKFSVPTRVSCSSNFLARLRIVNKVNEDVRSVLVRFETRLDRSLFGFQESLNLHVITVSQSLLSLVVDIAVDIGGIECSVPFVEFSAKMGFSRPDLVNIVLTCLSQVLLAGRRGGADLRGPISLST